MSLKVMTGKDQGFPLGLSHFFSFVTVYGLGGGPFHAFNEASKHMVLSMSFLGSFLIVPAGANGREHCGFGCINVGLVPVKFVPKFLSFSPDSRSFYGIRASGDNDI